MRLPSSSTLVILALIASPVSAGSTPEDVFKQMNEAYRKTGAKGFFTGLTNDSQKTLTGGMLTSFYGFRMFVLSRKEPNPEAVKLLDELMKRHGLDVKKLAPFKEKNPKTAEEAITNLKLLADLVKDAPAFVDDVIGTVNRFDAPFPPLRLTPNNPTLKDVKIRGDTAEGTVHYRYLGMDQSEPVYFRREGGYWKVDLLPGIRASFAPDKK